MLGVIQSQTSTSAAGPARAASLLTSTPAGPLRLITIFFSLSLLVSLAFLSVRNTYDDEYSNLRYVDLSVEQVIHKANSADVHPPGMYLLSRFAYQAIPSPRWMTLAELLFLYTGLGVFVFTVTPLLPTLGARLAFCLLALLHPQLLMWGNTIRWYGWWTGLALVTLTVALRPSAGERPALSYGRSAGLGLLLAALFYINYITLELGVALGAAMLFRYGLRAWKQYLLTLVLFAGLIAPQLHALIAVHIPGGQDQRAGLLPSLARLIEGLLCSEAYLPWHPLAILALLGFAAMLVYGMILAWRRARASHPLSAALLTGDPGLAGLVLFAVVFFLLVAASGLGIKARNGLLLVPLLALPVALVLNALRSSRLQAFALVLIAIWSGVGIEHLLGREGLSKSNMNNRPEELTRYLAQAHSAACSVVVTYDSLLGLTVATSHLPHMLLLTSEPSPIPLHDPRFQLSACPSIDLYRVESYRGGLGSWGNRLNVEMTALHPASLQPERTLDLSRDPDAAAKRKLTFLSGAGDLPDYRYIVTIDRISPAEFEHVEKALPDFLPADGQPRPMLRAVNVAPSTPPAM